MNGVHGTTTREAVAKRDREIALLLAGSGWTQQEIASRIGRAQPWVAQQINFGHFLSLSRRDTDDLTENRFRSLWARTAHIDNTPDRYDEVARLIEEEAGRPSQRSLHGQQIIEKYGDANWHRADKMADALQITEEELTAGIVIGQKICGPNRRGPRFYGKGTSRAKSGDPPRWRMPPPAIAAAAWGPHSTGTPGGSVDSHDPRNFI